MATSLVSPPYPGDRGGVPNKQMTLQVAETEEAASDRRRWVVIILAVYVHDVEGVASSVLLHSQAPEPSLLLALLLGVDSEKKTVH